MITATRPWSDPATSTGYPPDWRTRAACLGVDPELFYPLGEPGSRTYQRAAEPARAVCRHCPVLVDCLEDALVVKDRWAIRGGLDPVERGQQFGVKRRRKAVA